MVSSARLSPVLAPLALAVALGGRLPGLAWAGRGRLAGLLPRPLPE
jgi:hypothetical protein